MVLPVEGAVRPTVIKHRDMWWESVAEIVKRNSIDGAGRYGGWDTTLDEKRSDPHYEEVVRSIEKYGFIRPLTCLVRDHGEEYEFGDGHHRLAAAIDLGITLVPLEAFDERDPEARGKYYGGAVADDSGDWFDADHSHIPEENVGIYDDYWEEEDHECEGDEDYPNSCWICDADIDPEFCCEVCEGMTREEWNEREGK